MLLGQLHKWVQVEICTQMQNHKMEYDVDDLTLIEHVSKFIVCGTHIVRLWFQKNYSQVITNLYNFLDLSVHILTFWILLSVTKYLVMYYCIYSTVFLFHVT